ncbi:universal stress protein [Alisedimentitalea sp. MJ-SS2]|uniref:universal stress protein n=1 Tax=Aliisedimentitalea sp. MJ-SS2 TaxID=3049795 RepID=UPI0029106594|nr:universal stress protein [Alisedimentitalea sp. MJ-SS2]MDU8929592.1 universal stress protein [Alisedimentitalea sp. MJ-SS2]
MFKKILIPVDVMDEEDTQKLLTTAKALTENWECDRHVVTVTPNMGMAIVGSYFDANFEAESRKAAAEQLSAAIVQSGLDATQHVLTGTVYDRVIELAASLKADLILISAQQPDLRDYLLGSNAARIVRHSKQSVLVLRG